MPLSTAHKTDMQKRAAAEYIAIEASRLMRMAATNGFPLLSYLIDMAVLEAWREASEGTTPRSRTQAEGRRANSHSAEAG